MAIKHGNDPTAVIEPGKYILSESILKYGLCGKAGLVTKVAGKRVYYDRVAKDFEGDRATHVNADKIAFVCDTMEEVGSMVAVSNAATIQTGEQVAQIECVNRDYFKAKLDALIAGAA